MACGPGRQCDGDTKLTIFVQDSTIFVQDSTIFVQDSTIFVCVQYKMVRSSCEDSADISMLVQDPKFCECARPPLFSCRKKASPHPLLLTLTLSRTQLRSQAVFLVS